MIEILLSLFLGWQAASYQQHAEIGVDTTVSASYRAISSGAPILRDTHHQEPGKVELKWVKANLAALHPNLHGLAMLSQDRKRCVVLLPDITHDDHNIYVFGHEVLHCFKGLYHPPAIGEAMELRADTIDVARHDSYVALSSVLPVRGLAAIKEFLEGPSSR